MDKRCYHLHPRVQKKMEDLGLSFGNFTHDLRLSASQFIHNTAECGQKPSFPLVSCLNRFKHSLL
jgi:hypothetical protein